MTEQVREAARELIDPFIDQLGRFEPSWRNNIFELKADIVCPFCGGNTMEVSFRYTHTGGGLPYSIVRFNRVVLYHVYCHNRIIDDDGNVGYCGHWGEMISYNDGFKQDDEMTDLMMGSMQGALNRLINKPLSGI
jgi:hypothetical protein